MILPASSPSLRFKLTKCRVLAVVAAVAWLPVGAQADTSTLSQAEIEELDRNMARTAEAEAEATKSGNPVECGDDYCYGLYDQMITSLWTRFDGQIALTMTADAVAAINASSHSCARTYLIVGFQNESSASKRAAAQQIANQLQMARVLGHEIRLEWVQSNYTASWMVCRVNRVLVYGPPTP